MPNMSLTAANDRHLALDLRRDLLLELFKKDEDASNDTNEAKADGSGDTDT